MSEQAGRRIVDGPDTKKFFELVGGGFAERLKAAGYPPEQIFALAIVLGGSVQAALDQMALPEQTECDADGVSSVVSSGSVEIRIAHELGDFTDSLVPVDDGAARVIAPHYGRT